jgi:hypothetical protein
MDLFAAYCVHLRLWAVYRPYPGKSNDAGAASLQPQQQHQPAQHCAKCGWPAPCSHMPHCSCRKTHASCEFNGQLLAVS